MWKTIFLAVILFGIANCRDGENKRRRGKGGKRGSSDSLACGEYRVPYKTVFVIDSQAAKNSESDECQWKFTPQAPRSDLNLRMRCSFNLPNSPRCRDASVTSSDGNRGKNVFCGRRKHEEVNSSTGELLVTAQNIRNRRGEKSGRFRCLVSSFLNFKHTVPGGNPIVGKPIVDKFPIGAFPGFPRPPMPQGVCSNCG